MSGEFNRRQFGVSLAALPLSAPLLGWADQARAATSEDGLGFVGPMVGDVSETTANVWFRPSVAGSYQLHIQAPDGKRDLQTLKAEALPANDLCVVWRASRLKPDTKYHYSIHQGSKVLVEGGECQFKTAPAAGSPTHVRLAFGSCADMKPLPLWSQIESDDVQGLVLLGDTPYVDSTRLDVARQKHRTFLGVPELAKLIRHTPTWGTWDDHDFGGNDTDGRLKGKENTRRAFVEYRANREYGDGDQGIYTKFQCGPVEVFLLDTRWFSQAEPSPVDPSKPTLLGQSQWKWLKESLRSSKAEFKIIACGMIWDDKENKESDDWGTYTYERDALFEFIGKEGITGVVLIGGDIHCSRLLKYKTTEQVGYPIHQLIVSPIHDRTIPSLNVPHPDLVHGAAIPHVWLKVDVDTTGSSPTFRAEWVQMDGKPMWTLELTEADLKRSRL